jgi:uncharacterized protein
MPEALPVELDPFRHAGLGSRFSGRYPVRQMPRLASMLADEDGDVEVELEFRRDERGLAVVSGHAVAGLRVTCQRCLGTMPISLQTDIHLGIVRSDGEAERLPEGLEPLLVPTGLLRPREMVEDEIILGLPLVPRHPDETACQPHGDWDEATGQGGAERAEGPFAVLEQLKSKQ